MEIAISSEDRENCEQGRSRSALRNLAAGLHRAGLALALAIASLICVLSINDFRTGWSLLHSAANFLPRVAGRSIR
jgi:hypothetical protein